MAFKILENPDELMVITYLIKLSQIEKTGSNY